MGLADVGEDDVGAVATDRPHERREYGGGAPDLSGTAGGHDVARHAQGLRGCDGGAVLEEDARRLDVGWAMAQEPEQDLVAPTRLRRVGDQQRAAAALPV